MTSASRRLVATSPSEGWLSVLLLSAMALAMALAIDDATWVHGNSSLTDFLAIATLGGVAAGIGGSKVGWNRWVAHLVGATFAALIVSLLVGGLLRLRDPVRGHRGRCGTRMA